MSSFYWRTSVIAWLVHLFIRSVTIYYYFTFLIYKLFLCLCVGGVKGGGNCNWREYRGEGRRRLRFATFSFLRVCVIAGWFVRFVEMVLSNWLSSPVYRRFDSTLIPPLVHDFGL